MPFLHRGVEEWHLGRLITSRCRFESGPRNKEEKRLTHVRRFSLKGERLCSIVESTLA